MLTNVQIDFEESANLQHPAVKPNQDKELDEMKRKYSGLDSWLYEVAKLVKEDGPVARQNDPDLLDVGYYPRIGYVIQVREEVSEELRIYYEAIHKPWRRIFAVE